MPSVSLTKIKYNEAMTYLKLELHHAEWDVAGPLKFLLSERVLGYSYNTQNASMSTFKS